MLLTHTLPPPFLLPSWRARQLVLKLQRACLSDSTSGKRLIRKFKPKRPKLPNSPQLSLFDELFPEEKKSGRDDKQSKVDKLPPFQFDHNLERSWRGFRDSPTPVPGKWRTENGGDAKKLPHPTPQIEQEDEKKRREAAVLVLNSASKRLEESDFFRVGHKGVHIQGWTTGLIKGMDGVRCDHAVKLSWY
jgi:hypothetical protein